MLVIGRGVLRPVSIYWDPSSKTPFYCDDMITLCLSDLIYFVRKRSIMIARSATQGT